MLNNNTKIMKVVKRNGDVVDFDIEKINKVIRWAVEDLSGVSLSDIEMNAKINVHEGVTTREIHKILVESAANLFNEDAPNYQWVASRLMNYQLRKDVWGGKNAPKLRDLIRANVDRGVYHPEILDMYTPEEIDKIDEKIVHDRDYNFTYAGIKQLCDKYLIQNRKTKEIYETPQFAYMLIAMISFHKYPKDTRLLYIKRAYDAFSKFKINLPTPQMAGIRGTIKQYASCCLIDVDDTKESILSSVVAAGYATAQRYGIGLNFGRVRAIGTEVNNGNVVHTGVIPFLKMFESTVKSMSQLGLRGGGGTVNFTFFHYEIEDVLVLKNNGGTEDSRVRNLDYVIQFSKLFYERFMKNEMITLFSPHEVPDLYEAFGLPDFDALYVKYENDPKIRYKRTLRATHLMSLLVKERTETGRIYIMNIDHCNEHGSFIDRVTMTNLCLVGETLIDISTPLYGDLTIQIKDLEKYMKEGTVHIRSCDVETGNSTLSLVSDFAQTGVSDELIEIIDESTGHMIQCTPEHKIYTSNRGYVEAKDLLETDTLVLDA
jgi:ribonucleoside-diphosphate reductase alpha chain